MKKYFLFLSLLTMLFSQVDALSKKKRKALFADLSSSSSSSSSSSKSDDGCDQKSLVIVADLKILGRFGADCLLLEDNTIYEPYKQKYKTAALNWQVDDCVRLYKTDPDMGMFFLLNFRTGQTIKATLKCI